MSKAYIALLAVTVASPALAHSVALEDMARIISPYAECEAAGSADVKALYDKWLPAVQLATQNPGDSAARTRADQLSNELRLQREQTKIRCDYEGVQSRLQARILKLHPKVSQPMAYWTARNVFFQLDNINQELIKYEEGTFPPPPPPPPIPPK